jgi:hypothetical protein
LIRQRGGASGDRIGVRDLTPEQRANLPWDPLAPVVIPGTDLRIGGSIDRLDLAATGNVARVTDYKSGKPPGNGREPMLKGGAELQRCLYAFAVRSLLSGVSSVSSRLLYPKAAEGGLYSLADPDAVLSRLAEFAAAAARLAAAGNLPAKVSMMIMRPPQQRQGRGSTWGSSAVVVSDVSAGFERDGTASNSRARAMLAARLPLANNP